MSVLYIRDSDGNFQQIRTIKGDKGDRGEKGDTGKAEEYELIEEFTLESASGVYRAYEPDGTAYNFKRALVTIENNVAMPGFNLQFYNTLDDLPPISQTWMWEHANTTSSTLHVFMECEIAASGIARTLASNAWATGSATNSAAAWARYVGAGSTIMRIGTNNSLPAGTIVRIFGIRAA